MKEHDPFDGEWVDDVLLAVVAEHIARETPTLLDDHERYMSWLSRDLRRRPPAADDWSPDRIRRVRRRIIERALAERLGVPTGREAPRMREVAPAPVSLLLEDAAGQRTVPWLVLAVAAGEGRELWDEECDRVVELPAGVPDGRYLALAVAGDSMQPALHAGDTILVRLGDDLQRDTMVVARRGDDEGYVVKRVGRLGRREIELTSINPRYAPVRIARRPGAILGTVVMRWCAHDATQISAPSEGR